MINYTPLLVGLEELATIEIQHSRWVEGKNEISSFTEAICQVFDDSHLAKAIDSGHLANEFSNEIFSNVTKLDKLIDSIPEFESPQVIIEHPKMKNIRNLAQELFMQFRDRKTRQAYNEVNDL